MTTKTNADAPLSRRKMLTRTGLVAAAAYTVPAFTTLSMAQAGSGASGGGNDNSSNDSSSNDGGSSSASTASTASTSSGPSGSPTTTDSVGGGNTSTALDLCGVENLNDPTYLQCLIDNGL